MTNAELILIFEDKTKEAQRAIQNDELEYIEWDGGDALDKLFRQTHRHGSGVAEKLIEIYEKTDDKTLFETLFRTLTGTSFNQYLCDAIDAIVRSLGR